MYNGFTTHSHRFFFGLLCFFCFFFLPAGRFFTQRGYLNLDFPPGYTRKNKTSAEYGEVITMHTSQVDIMML